MHPRLHELDVLLARHHQDVLDAVSAIPADARERRLAASGWSVAEHIDHLSRVDAAGAALLVKRAMRARESGVGPDGETSSIAGRLDHLRVADSTTPLQAPEVVCPAADVPFDAAMTEWERSRAALRDAMRAYEEIDATKVMLRHPIAGEIDAYQWLLLTAQHQLRHARQIARLGAALAASSAEG